MSRPAVESTLFRARRRLTEEYDELASGQRCVRIQTIIAGVGSTGRLGARDTRRLARHVAHCQPCRREAVAAGVDSALLARRPMRERVAAKIAALLPFPLLRRGGGDGGSSWLHQLPLMGDQAQPVAKLAAAAVIVVAGLGVGSQVVPERGAGGNAGAGAGGLGKSGTRVSSPVKSDGAVVRPATLLSGADARAGGKAKTEKRAKVGSRRRTGKGAKALTRRGAGNGGSRTTAPAAGGGTTTPAGGQSGGGSAGSGSRSSSGGKAPAVKVPGVTTQGGAVDKTTDAVNQTTDQVTDTVDQVTSGATAPVTGAVDDTVEDVTDTVDGAAEDPVGTVGGAVQDPVGTVGGTVGGVVGSLP